ncbi:hypothetical protein VFPPC_09872 [Pochonia chlamydosporia 170]|uniref:Uncharacterized protein n=1 Tax=Pochonia chlamydosporia 170 TaxID=1380566 RepID=A0A179FDW8_METCM|nr:hypothetical protein VFPPC_09872 [Pochonia chlamydosporia 170]OAQ63431.2 hypothetical protein VFPPC_09872 [Pochonia chlamydosporia 170]
MFVELDSERSVASACLFPWLGLGHQTVMSGGDHFKPAVEYQERCGTVWYGMVWPGLVRCCCVRNGAFISRAGVWPV